MGKMKKTDWEIADEIDSKFGKDVVEKYGQSLSEAWLNLLDYNQMPPKATVLKEVNEFLSELGHPKIVDYWVGEEQYLWEFEDEVAHATIVTGEDGETIH